MSEISEDKPRPRYRVRGQRVMVRVPNSGLPTYAARSPWQVIPVGMGHILPPNVHPSDLEHLLRVTAPGPFGGPMLELVDEELPVSLCLHPRPSECRA